MAAFIPYVCPTTTRLNTFFLILLAPSARPAARGTSAIVAVAASRDCSTDEADRDPIWQADDQIRRSYDSSVLCSETGSWIWSPRSSVERARKRAIFDPIFLKPTLYIIYSYVSSKFEFKSGEWIWWNFFFFLLIREANNFYNFKLKCFYRELR